MRSQSKKIILCSLGAGIVNGLLGTGGGILIMMLLRSLMSDTTKAMPLFIPRNNDRTEIILDSDASARNVFAMTVIAILPLSAVSCIVYFLRGKLDFGSSLPYMLGALGGGLCGAMALQKIKPVWLKRLFAGLLIFAGLKILFF